MLIIYQKFSRGLVGLELSVESSYPLGRLKNNVTRYDVTLIFAAFAKSIKTASACVFLPTIRVKCEIFLINN